MKRAALLAFFVLLAACGKKTAGKAGDPCANEGATICDGSSAALVCTNGTWEALACRDGCAGEPARCANDAYAEGEPCTRDGEKACATDRASLLACKAKHWRAIDACLGPSACSGAACDASIAKDGAICAREGAHACSADRTAMLRCTGGAWKTSDACLGEAGCAVHEKDVTCDATVSRAGAPCSHDRKDACTEDGKAVLRCVRGAMAAHLTCGGAAGCKRKGRAHIECDQSIAAVGDACDTDGERACAADASAELVCVHGKFQTKRACSKCRVVEFNIACE